MSQQVLGSGPLNVRTLRARFICPTLYPCFNTFSGLLWCGKASLWGTQCCTMQSLLFTLTHWARWWLPEDSSCSVNVFSPNFLISMSSVHSFRALMSHSSRMGRSEADTCLVNLVYISIEIRIVLTLMF